jgi:hypothetical protein
MNNKILKHAILNALGTVLYIAAIVSLVFYAPKIVGSNGPDTVLIPIGMLCLLVLSAALTGFLVFGRPVLWYLDGKKKEALSLLAWTLGVLLAITIIVFLVVLLMIRA